MSTKSTYTLTRKEACGRYMELFAWKLEQFVCDSFSNAALAEALEKLNDEFSEACGNEGLENYVVKDD